jgi:hypothetical protein
MSNAEQLGSRGEGTVQFWSRACDFKGLREKTVPFAIRPSPPQAWREESRTAGSLAETKAIALLLGRRSYCCHTWYPRWYIVLARGGYPCPHHRGSRGRQNSRAAAPAAGEHRAVRQALANAIEAPRAAFSRRADRRSGRHGAADRRLRRGIRPEGFRRRDVSSLMVVEASAIVAALEEEPRRPSS